MVEDEQIKTEVSPFAITVVRRFSVRNRRTDPGAGGAERV